MKSERSRFPRRCGARKLDQMLVEATLRFLDRLWVREVPSASPASGYGWLKTTTGSTRAARRAGNVDAARAMTPSVATTIIMMKGSIALNP